MSSSRRTRRRRERKSFSRHQPRLEGLEKRYALNAAPVLDPSASPQLNSVTEDAGIPVGQVGTLVSDLIDTGGTHNNFSDVNGDLPGIAITGVNLQGGALWYSSDDGSTWLDVGAVSGEAPRLLAADATTRVYFEPAEDFTGTVSDVITIRAWDRNIEWMQLGLDIGGEAEGDQSGHKMSLSSDGQTVAIGAFRNNGNGFESGHVRIYRRDPLNNTWAQVGADIDGEAEGDRSGMAVSLSSDGQIVAIGAPRNDGNTNDSGHVRVYHYNSVDDSWNQLGADIDGESGGDFSGIYLSMSSNGQTLAIGATGNDGNGNKSGHVRIYQYDDLSDIWRQLGSDIDGESADDRQATVSLSSDGRTVAVGAQYNDGGGNDAGRVRIYRYVSSTASWDQLGPSIDGKTAEDQSGHWPALSADGEIVAVGSHFHDGNGLNSGHTRVYEYDAVNSVWMQLGSDIHGEAEGDQSGHKLSLSADGRTIAIAAFLNDGNGTHSGHVRLYEYDLSSENWEQLGSDIDGKSAGDQLGESVSLSGDGRTVAIGAHGNDDNGVDSGHVQIFQVEPTVSQFTETVSITINPVNEEPTLNALSDININEDDPEQVIKLTSISAGIGEAQELRVTAISSNTNLIPNPTTDYTSPNSTGSLIFTPVPGENGTASITVTLEDAGLDNNFNTTEDNRQATYQFEVNVFEVISKSDSATLAKDGLGNLYVNTHPVTYKEQQAQTNINGFAAIGASPEDGENALLVERSSVRYRLVADESWRINGLFHSLHNESSLPLNRLDRWVTMFNGQDLSGWRANSENPDSFRVENGVLVVDGGRSHLFWIGDPENPEDEELTNFHWHAKVKTMPNANSGLYFHTQYQESGWPSAGYEAQVNQTAVDRRKTGGLYAIADVLDTSPVEDGEWYTYDIIVDGKRIVLKINGVVTTDWTEPDDWQPPQHMLGRKLSQGTVAIQAHDPESIVHYKDIRIKRLP